MDVEEMVFEYVFNKFKLEVVLSTLLSDFVEDSMDRVEMLFEIEELFGVRLGEEDVLGVETVGDLCTKVRGLLG
jgi:acyl carrier protein